MVTATLQVVYLSPSNWRVLDGEGNRSVQHVGEGFYRCTCPLIGDCAHIQAVKARPAAEGDQGDVAPVRQEPKSLPAPAGVIERIERLRNELSSLLYGFKPEYVEYGFDLEIERLRMELSTVMRMGFGKDQQFVFINDKHNCMWYMMDGDTCLPIKGPYLFGQITAIEFKPRKGDGRPSHHLHCTVESDRKYILHTGYDNHFSKGMIATVAQMSPEQLRMPVWIQARQTGKTILCNLHQQGQLIRGFYHTDDSKNDWAALTRQAKKNLAIAQAF